MTNLKELLERLEKMRKTLDWSKEKMARELDVSLSSYMNWTTEGKPDPGGENALKILDFLKEKESNAVGERWLIYGDPGDSDRMPVEKEGKKGTLPVSNLNYDFVERAEHKPGEILLNELSLEEEQKLLKDFRKGGE